MRGKDVIYIYGKLFRWLALAIVAVFGAIGWVLSALCEDDRRSEEEDLPWVDPSRSATDYPRYNEDGFRQY